MLRSHIARRLPPKLASVVGPEDVLQDVWQTAIWRRRIKREGEIPFSIVDWFGNAPHFG